MQKSLSSSSILHATDVDLYGQSIRPEQSEYLVTSRGPFAAKVAKIDFHRLRMQCLDELRPRAWRITIPAARSAICFNRKPGSLGYLGGMEIQQAGFGLLAPERSVWHRSTGPFHFASMSLPIEDMSSESVALIGRDLTPPYDALSMQIPASAVERLRQLHNAAGHLAETAPEIIANREAARGLEEALIEALFDCLGQGHLREDTASWRRRSVVVKRFFAFIAERAEEPLYLTDVCAAIGVNQRSLHSCCAEHLGVSPKRFLTLRRLHLAQRALAQVPSTATTVTEIATQFGFWELGRFAVEYKAVFAESPSKTLRRAHG